MVRDDPCPACPAGERDSQVRTNHDPRSDPCHLVWQVNQILRRSMNSVHLRPLAVESAHSSPFIDDVCQRAVWRCGELVNVFGRGVQQADGLQGRPFQKCRRGIVERF